MLPTLTFDDVLLTPTKRTVSCSSSLFLSKNSPSLNLRAHLKPIDAISQDMLGLENRVQRVVSCAPHRAA